MEFNDGKAARALHAVRRWLAALDARDLDGLLDVSSAMIVVVEARGESHGHDELRAWVARSAFAATPLHWYAGPDTVVVEQLAAWTPNDPEVGAPSAGVRSATAFSVLEGLVTRIERFDDLDAALYEAWLTREDLVVDDAPA